MSHEYASDAANHKIGRMLEWAERVRIAGSLALGRATLTSDQVADLASMLGELQHVRGQLDGRLPYDEFLATVDTIEVSASGLARALIVY